MDDREIIQRVVAVEFAFGTGYAIFLSKTRIGRYLADDQTWISVVIGVIGTVLIGLPVLGWHNVGRLAMMFVGSGTPIIVRSLLLDMNSKSFWYGVRRALEGGEQGDGTT